ncbi:peptidoglycan DD-metalloendopeptidase family protein [Microbacteriaceae bacterium VKM Ac-2854]|nr:peptidoglycan DD-metalloendopeptidase family protein [Microbacteriaceae bacterium VKM Ac-2854]
MRHLSPRPAPRRRPSSSAPRRANGLRRASSALALIVALIAGLVVATPASADEYPTWAEVEAAKGNTAAAAAQVENIRTLIANLQSEVVAAQALAEQRGEEYFAAQEAADQAAEHADKLQKQADEGQAKADAASKQAGLLAAQLYRTTGTDLSVNIFLDGQGGQADQLLSKIGNMTKLVERSSGIYEQASAAKNTASALGAQAEVAKAEREKLRIAAETALVQAQEAQQASEQALATQQAQSIVLEQQLAALQDTENKTVADYQAGVAAREAERARLAALAAAAGNGSSAGASLDAGQLSDQGWAVPAAGRITGTFGPRASISTGGGSSSSSHRGTDIAGGCGIPIYAATGGTVTYAGPNGTYGNFVLIDHGAGISTGYAHIRDGGIFVRVGQTVSAGANIASVGTTGASTGCHLHFEVRINGTAVDAQPFMAARGVPLG